MASFKATTRIKYGAAAAEGEQSVVTIFEVGDIVTGLSNDEMKQLWDAGALEAVAESKPALPAKVESPAE